MLSKGGFDAANNFLCTWFISKVPSRSSNLHPIFDIWPTLFIELDGDNLFVLFSSVQGSSILGPFVMIGLQRLGQRMHVSDSMLVLTCSLLVWFRLSRDLLRSRTGPAW